MDFIKKFWFILLIGLILVGMFGYMLIDTSKGVLKGKKENGKDVVFELYGQNYTADDLYDEMAKQQNMLVLNFVQRMIIRSAYEPDKDLLTDAKLQADQVEESWKGQYGTEYKEKLNQALVSQGWEVNTDLKDYFVMTLMYDKLLSDYFDSVKDTYSDKYMSEKTPRLVSHILVKMDDPDKPTAEEQKKMADVDAALKDGKTFEDAAKEFSDDGSASSGGALGIVDKNTSFVKEFLNHALENNVGNTLTWVKTEYGMHLIKIVSTSKEDIVAHDGFRDAVVSAYPEISDNFFKDLYGKTTIDFKGNTELETYVKNAMEGTN